MGCPIHLKGFYLIFGVKHVSNSWHRVLYSFIFAKMNTVDRILNFINSQDETMTVPQELSDHVAEEQQQPEHTEQEPANEPIREELAQAKPANEPMREEITAPAGMPSASRQVPQELSDGVADYKKTLQQLNRLIKRQEFPCIAKIDGNNKVFNNSAELSDMLNQMKASHRLQLKEMKRQHIDNYKHFSEEYKGDDEDIEDDGMIYKRGDIVAVKKDDKIYKAPRTNKKDRQRIYNSIKDNKKLLTDLTLSKDEEHFKTISSDNLRDEELNIYHKHRDNKINKDSTWTRASFLSMMNKLLNDASNTTAQSRQATPSLRQQYITQQTPPASSNKSAYGLNPLLFGRM